MNCSDFTSSNGNRNGKRNYGAANCGARTKQYHNSSTDFFVRFLAPQKRSSERGGVNELVPIFLRIALFSRKTKWNYCFGGMFCRWTQRNDLLLVQKMMLYRVVVALFAGFVVL